MKFNLGTVGYFYSTERKEFLEKYGFKFKKNKPKYGFGDDERWYKDDKWYKDDNEPTIEISSLEELLELSKETGCSLSVNGITKSIDIVDDYY